MKRTNRSILFLVVLYVFVVFGCQTVTDLIDDVEPVGGGGQAQVSEISLREVLEEYARAQGWPEPGDTFCEDYGSVIQPLDTVCFYSIGSEFEVDYGMGISYYRKYNSGEGNCHLGSTASIFIKVANTMRDIPEGADYQVEVYREVAVDQFTYNEETLNGVYFHWSEDDLDFYISELAYGLNCQYNYPNTQPFQVLIDLVDQGYLVQ
jgi:hypothetical protein